MTTQGFKRLFIALAVAAVLLAATPPCLRSEETPAASLSKTEFVRLSERLRLKNQPWARIPWKVSVTEARRLAFQERKPIFLVVNTGNCLGWT
jgi:hypothetical protein